MMEISKAISTLDRLLQQHQAMLDLRGVFDAARVAERSAKEHEQTIARRKQEIAALDSAIADRKAEESGFRARHDEIIRTAMAAAVKIKDDARIAAQAEVVKVLQEVARHQKSCDDLQLAKERYEADINRLNIALASSRKDLDRINGERASINAAIKKLAEGGR